MDTDMDDAKLEPEPELLLCLGPHCSARFRDEDGLNAHYRAEHSFTCNWVSCDAASFRSNNALLWHVKADHLLVCPIPGCCELGFPSKEALDAHLKVRLGHGDGLQEANQQLRLSNLRS